MEKWYSGWPRTSGCPIFSIPGSQGIFYEIPDYIHFSLTWTPYNETSTEQYASGLSAKTRTTKSTIKHS